MKNHKTRGALVLTFLAVLVCSDSYGQRNNSLPTNEELLAMAPEGVTVFPDLAYREGHEAWKLDLAMPTTMTEDPLPVIVYLHGGGWTQGDKRGQGIGTVLNYATEGFVGVSVNYRLDVDKKACIEDAKCAIRWLRAHAEQYNMDPDRIGAAGNSAGAHLALMLALCDPSAGLEGDGPYQEFSSAVQSAHCSSTPIMPRFGRGKAAGRDVKQIQPMTYVRADAPPLYFIHGAQDTRKAPITYMDAFAEAMREAGAKDFTYQRHDDAGHGVYVQYLQTARPARTAFFGRTLMEYP
jgi:acetyl esterase/lipase